jgi:PAS domain S-box-containing protein
MLESQEESRLFGVPHRHIVAGLSLAAAVLIVLLAANVIQLHFRVPGPELSREALQHLQGDRIRQGVLLLLIIVTCAAATLTIRHYYVTKERLARLQNTAGAILESLAGGVLMIDLTGRVVVMNRAAERLLGAGTGSPLDLPWLEEHHPEIAGVIREALEERKYAQERECRVTAPKGGSIVLRVTTSEHMGESGRWAGVIVALRDATRLVKMESQLRRRDRLAAMGTLAAGVAHEIRNPLSALALNVSLLREEVLSGSPSRGELEEYFDVLIAETQRLDRITGNFLRLARPVAMTKAPLSVLAPLRQVIRLLEIEAREKHVAFDTQFGSGQATVLGDHTHLEQVFLNILINAMQAMPQGGSIRVTTRTDSDEDGPYVEIVFADTGVGIPQENVACLFDPYFTTRDTGTGLGLAIADRIVTEHGGRILVESTPGSGTTMIVRLPLVALEEKQPA